MIAADRQLRAGEETQAGARDSGAFRRSWLDTARYFIDRFATGLWAIQGGTVRTYVDLEDMRRAQRRG